MYTIYVQIKNHVCGFQRVFLFRGDRLDFSPIRPSAYTIIKYYSWISLYYCIRLNNKHSYRKQSILWIHNTVVNILTRAFCNICGGGLVDVETKQAKKSNFTFIVYTSHRFQGSRYIAYSNSYKYRFRLLCPLHKLQSSTATANEGKKIVTGEKFNLHYRNGFASNNRTNRERILGSVLKKKPLTAFCIAGKKNISSFPIEQRLHSRSVIPFTSTAVPYSVHGAFFFLFTCTYTKNKCWNRFSVGLDSRGVLLLLSTEVNYKKK